MGFPLDLTEGSKFLFNHTANVPYKDVFYIQNLGAYVKPTNLYLASPDVAVKLH